MALLYFEGFDFAAANEPPEATWLWQDWNGNLNTWSYVAGRFGGRHQADSGFFRYHAAQ